MGCGSCGSGGCSTGGCGKSGGCASGGCNKLNAFDWLGNMLPPEKSEVDNVYEIRFKNTRKAFYRNVNGLRLYIGDPVVVESDRGYDVGNISLGGVVAELQMRKKKNQKSTRDVLKIYRKANENDLELLKRVRDREQETLVRSREIVGELGLDMKLSDVEFQGDNAKAIFYYIADHRVDFRELIKILAREFRIRVEMKQIGLRHEAGLVGGIGSCGRELCCSTWLTEFRTVNTAAARYQNLSLNPMKISGQCGRLKCCLNFELDAYLDALEDFPEVNSIDTAKGRAFLQKTDIFKRKMWFSYPNETSWYPLEVDEVKRVMKMNDKGEKPENLAKLQVQSKLAEASLDFVDVVGTNVPEVERRRRDKNKNRRGGGNRNNRGGSNRNQPQNRRQGDRRRGQNQNQKNDQQKPKGQGKDATQQGRKEGQQGDNRNRNNKQGGRPPRGKGGNNRNRNNRNNQNRSGQNKNRPPRGQQKDGPKGDNQKSDSNDKKSDS